MKELVSIIVPVYNGEKYIEKCITNLLGQTYENIEIVMINDGSKDNTEVMLEECSKKDERIKVIHQKNQGLSGARNTGIDNATGKYVVFVDVDDEIAPALVEDNVALAEKNNADIVLYSFWYYDVDSDTITQNEYNGNFSGDAEKYFHGYLKKTIDNEIFNAPWNKMIRRDILINNQLRFDTRYPIFEDIIFAPRVLSYSKSIVVNSKPYYKYYVHSSGSLITKFYDNIYDCILQAYHNGIDYCSKFNDNTEQKHCFDGIIIKYTLPHIKQICMEKTINKRRKRELLHRIINDECMKKAIDTVDFEGRKKIISFMIKHSMVRTCYYYYRCIEMVRGLRR